MCFKFMVELESTTYFIGKFKAFAFPFPTVALIYAFTADNDAEDGSAATVNFFFTSSLYVSHLRFPIIEPI